MDFLTCEPFELQGLGTPKQPKHVLLGFRQTAGYEKGYGAAGYRAIVLEGYESFPTVQNLFEYGLDFWASSPNQVPQPQLQLYRDLKREMEAKGYISLGKYHNAVLNPVGTIDGDFVEGDVGIGDVLATDVISWEFKPGPLCSEDALRKCIAQTRTKMQLSGNDEVLLVFPSYRICAETSPIMQNDCIDLSGQYGAFGEFSITTDYQPLLALLHMNKQFNRQEAEFKFVDSMGQELSFDNFTAIKQPFINLPGYDEKALRKLAVQLELASPLIDLSKTKADIENFFF